MPGIIVGSLRDTYQAILTSPLSHPILSACQRVVVTRGVRIRMTAMPLKRELASVCIDRLQSSLHIKATRGLACGIKLRRCD